MKFRIEITRTAEKQLKKLSSEAQKRISQAILLLAEDAYPPGCKKMHGFDDTFRIRVGNYRIIYMVNDKTIVITVLKIGHRKEIYG